VENKFVCVVCVCVCVCVTGVCIQGLVLARQVSTT
jgi:hypothetical protein